MNATTNGVTGVAGPPGPTRIPKSGGAGTTHSSFVPDDEPVEIGPVCV